MHWDSNICKCCLASKAVLRSCLTGSSLNKTDLSVACQRRASINSGRNRRGRSRNPLNPVSKSSGKLASQPIIPVDDDDDDDDDEEEEEEEEEADEDEARTFSEDTDEDEANVE